MPQWMATLIGVGFTLLGNLAITAYFFGRISQSVESNKQTCDEREKAIAEELKHQSGDMRDQWGHIGNLRADMGKVKGKLGINGA